MPVVFAVTRLFLYEERARLRLRFVIRDASYTPVGIFYRSKLFYVVGRRYRGNSASWQFVGGRGRPALICSVGVGGHGVGIKFP